ncbi:MAG: cyclic nucleotide-binding domain-containing protein [Acidobacteria bacterium]|nr:cyclic nucleotide-binding domain-containing protein [Acidobacteriota bacterium]
MQTSAIRYRVADFLKQHPPFDAVDMADLLQLAERGRVKFHESDEFVFWQGSAHREHLYVVQQGTVCLVEQGDGAERRRDILGAGEILGLERFLDAPVYRYSAKTASDVVLYALPAADFAPLLERYPRLRQHLATYAAVLADPAHSSDLAPVVNQPLRERLGPQEPYVIGAQATPAQAAAELLRLNAEALGVIDAGQLVGTLTRAQLLGWLSAASDAAAPSAATVDQLMSADVPTVSAEAPVHAALLRLADRDSTLLVTRDGTRTGELKGVLSAGHAALALADDPLDILRAIDMCPGVPELAQLRAQAEAFVAGQLLNAQSVAWLAQLGHRVHQRILRRLLQVLPATPCELCWCFLGAAGRGELVTPMAPVLAVVTADRAGLASATRALELVTASLEACGYRQPEDALDPVLCCATLDDWTGRFETWISDPVLSGISLARPFFDLAPLDAQHPLWTELHARVSAQVRAQPAFSMLLANDCLEHLPPMTFVEDRVVEDSGQPSNVFHLQRTAIGPLTDAGRVLGIAAGMVLGAPTLDRLRAARQMLPSHQNLLRDAEQTLLVVLYHQARTGIREGSDGATIPPSALSRPERQVLKTAFRSLTQLLEVTAEWGWQKPS